MTISLGTIVCSMHFLVFSSLVQRHTASYKSRRYLLSDWYENIAWRQTYLKINASSHYTTRAEGLLLMWVTKNKWKTHWIMWWCNSVIEHLCDTESKFIPQNDEQNKLIKERREAHWVVHYCVLSAILQHSKCRHGKGLQNPEPGKSKPYDLKFINKSGFTC